MRGISPALNPPYNSFSPLNSDRKKIPPPEGRERFEKTIRP